MKVRFLASTIFKVSVHVLDHDAVLLALSTRIRHASGSFRSQVSPVTGHPGDPNASEPGRRTGTSRLLKHLISSRTHPYNSG